MSSFESAVTKQAVATIYTDLVQYYGIYPYVKNRLKAIGKPPFHVNSIPQFWSTILREQYFDEFDPDMFLQDGQQLEFKDNFYLSEWSPKMPGKMWTKDGQAFYDIQHGQINDPRFSWCDKYEIVFDENGKKKALAAGYGSVRINPSKNPSEAFMLMSLTTPDNWDIDSGIPVIVSKGVYEEYRKKSEQYGAVEVAKLRGILIKNKDLPLSSIIPHALGSSISQKEQDVLTKAINLPKVYVYVPSRLDVEFRFNNSHPECCGWTMYKKDTPEIHQKTYTQGVNYEFGVTYNCFDPTDPDSLMEAVTFMNDYIQYQNGTEVITDFDGMVPRFESRIDIRKNPINRKVLEFRKTVKEMSELTNSLKV